MSYEAIRNDLQTLDDYVGRLRMRTSPDAVMVKQMDLVREFLKDHEASADEAYKKWKIRVKEFIGAQIAVKMLSRAVSELLKTQEGELRRYLNVILEGEITQGGDPEQARNWYYELWVAALLSAAGFIVNLREPDIVISGKGLSQPIGIACKYPSSEQQLHPNITKGYSQLAKHSLKGFVALGIDQLVFAKYQLGASEYVNLDSFPKHAQFMLEGDCAELSTRMIKEREQRFPSEVPLDEIMVTATIGGVIGNQRQMTFVNAVIVTLSEDCKIQDDLRRIYDALDNVPGFVDVRNVESDNE